MKNKLSQKLIKERRKEQTYEIYSYAVNLINEQNAVASVSIMHGVHKIKEQKKKGTKQIITNKPLDVRKQYSKITLYDEKLPNMIDSF